MVLFVISAADAVHVWLALKVSPYISQSVVRILYGDVETRENILRNHNQRTNGPVNAHLISWPSKAQNIQNLGNIW